MIIAPTRRRFLFGSSAAIVAASSLMAVSTKALGPWPYVAGVPFNLKAPKLWGDGVHDDTAALQWRINDAEKNLGYVILPRGNYRLSGPGLIFKKAAHVYGSSFLTEKFDNTPLLTFKYRGGGFSYINNCEFKSNIAPAIRFI